MQIVILLDLGLGPGPGLGLDPRGLNLGPGPGLQCPAYPVPIGGLLATDTRLTRCRYLLKSSE